MTLTLKMVLATTNHGKLLELRALLADLPLRFVSVSEVLGEPRKVVEDGATFEENALLKARAVAHATGLWSLADDSGLEVDALAGRPGVRSARYAHEGATDAENNAALLRDLAEVEAPRSARFRCVLALINPEYPEQAEVVHGSCEGSIARAPRGHGGFGYDPLFIVDGCGERSMAQLSDDEKNRLSHRARAVHALRAVLVSRLDLGDVI